MKPVLGDTVTTLLELKDKVQLPYSLAPDCTVNIHAQISGW